MKKFYRENRVFVILMGVALICIAIIIGMMASYIIKSSGSNTYGNRLDGIKDVPIDDNKKGDMEESLLAMEKVSDAVVNVHGKIVYFDIDVLNDTTVGDAQNICITALEYFEENYLNFYDIQFIVTAQDAEESDTTYPIMGYRKAGSSAITWSNNIKK